MAHGPSVMWFRPDLSHSTRVGDIDDDAKAELPARTPVLHLPLSRQDEARRRQDHNPAATEPEVRARRRPATSPGPPTGDSRPNANCRNESKVATRIGRRQPGMARTQEPQRGATRRCGSQKPRAKSAADSRTTPNTTQRKTRLLPRAPSRDTDIFLATLATELNADMYRKCTQHGIGSGMPAVQAKTVIPEVCLCYGGGPTAFEQRLREPRLDPTFANFVPFGPNTGQIRQTFEFDQIWPILAKFRSTVTQVDRN